MREEFCQHFIEKFFQKVFEIFWGGSLFFFNDNIPPI